MDVKITRSNDIWSFDPQVGGYDETLWKTITGTPAIAGTILRLTSAEIISYQVFKNLSVEFAVTVPTAPATGDSKAWGLKNYSKGNKARAEFDITDAVFTAKVYDESGTVIASKTITWDATWTAAEARYRISISERNVFFAVDDTIVARFEDVNVAKSPVSLHIVNADADNLDVGAVVAY